MSLVTILSLIVPGEYHGPCTGPFVARLEAYEDFSSSEGNPITKGNGYLTFGQEFGCTLNDTTRIFTIAQGDAYATTNSSRPNTKYRRLAIYDVPTGRLVTALYRRKGIKIPQGTSPTTWEALRIYTEGATTIAITDMAAVETYIDTKFTALQALGFVSKTGNETIAGTKTFSDDVHLADTSLLLIGTGTRSAVAQGGAIALARQLTGIGNAHGFDEDSTLDRSGTAAMAAFGISTNIVGTHSYDHFVGVQDAPTIRTSGVLTNLYGFTCTPSVVGATVTNRHGLKVVDCVPSGGGSIVNQYGVYIDGLVGGTNNWSVYAPTTKSFFGGNMLVGGGERTPRATLDVFGGFKSGITPTALIAFGTGFPTGEGGLFLAGDGAGYSEIQSVLEGTGTTPLILQRRGGNIGVGTTTPRRKIDVLDAFNPQFRASYADNTVYTDLQTDSSGNFTITPSGTKVMLADAKNLAFSTFTGSKIGTATGEKIGFWGAAPVVQQILATGASHTVDDVITLLQTLGLCKQS